MYYLKDKNAGMQKTSYQERNILQLRVQHPTYDTPDVCPGSGEDAQSLPLSYSNVSPL